MKKTIYCSFAAFALLLSGCGGGDEGSCRFKIQNDLDKGNYNAVIGELGNPASTCRSSYANNEWQIDLGAAYMGAAGLGVSDVIGIIGTDTGSGTNFGTFIDSVSAKQNDTALSNLGKSGEAYLAALNGTSCNSLSLTNSQKDICLYVGLAETLLATTTVSYLVPNISALFDTNNTVAQTAAQDDMTASMCALQFAVDGTKCAQAASVTGTNVTFTYPDASTKAFTDINVTLTGGADYYRLATAATPGSTVVTDGYCSNDFSNPSTTWSAGLYACPINKDPLQTDLNITTLLVDTLNNGLDAASGALASDPALQQDIVTYKQNIDTLGNGDGTITVNEIQAYLLTL